jgi:hypothetical protein
MGAVTNPNLTIGGTWRLHHGARAIAHLALTGTDTPWIYAVVEAARLRDVPFSRSVFASVGCIEWREPIQLSKYIRRGDAYELGVVPDELRR